MQAQFRNHCAVALLNSPMAAIDQLWHRIGGQQLNESLISASKVALVLFDLDNIVGLFCDDLLGDRPLPSDSILTNKVHGPRAAEFDRRANPVRLPNGPFSKARRYPLLGLKGWFESQIVNWRFWPFVSQARSSVG
jgi:hypothetical protein